MRGSDRSVPCELPPLNSSIASIQTLTYCGLFDDFASRHGSGIDSVDALNEQLLFSVLFGDPLVVNDGYVAVHRSLRHAVAETRKSPFCKLVEQGHIKILTRNSGDLGSVLAVMSQARISSASPLLKDTKSNKQLISWTKNLQGAPKKCFMRWPSYDSSVIFRRIASRALDRACELHPAAEVEMSKFRDALSQTEGRRTEWEDVAARLGKEGSLSKETRAVLMTAANDAYQYSRAAALSAGKRDVRLQMRPPTYVSLDEITDSVPPNEKREAISLFVPDLRLARKRVHSEWDRLAAMAEPTHSVALAKARYRDALKLYYTTDQVDEAKMQDAADAYSAELAQHFKSKLPAAAMFDVGVPVLGAAAGLLVVGTGGVALGLGIGLAGTLGAKKGGKHWVMKFTPAKPTGWIKKLDNASKTDTSWFQIDRDAAAAAVKGVSRFRPGSHTTKTS